jgi:hypothetical protein
MGGLILFWQLEASRLLGRFEGDSVHVFPSNRPSASAVVFRFVRCGQLTAGLSPMKVRPCRCRPLSSLHGHLHAQARSVTRLLSSHI